MLTREAFLTPISRFFVLRAGVSGLAQFKYYVQVQAIARPANVSDPKLKLWIKTPTPVIGQAPANGLSAQFRDPTTAWRQVRASRDALYKAGCKTDRSHMPGWLLAACEHVCCSSVHASRLERARHGSGLPRGPLQQSVRAPEAGQHVAQSRRCVQDGLWHTAIGALESCLGAAALYTSPDFQTWTPAGTWTDQVSPPCDQFAKAAPSTLGGGTGVSHVRTPLNE